MSQHSTSRENVVGVVLRCTHRARNSEKWHINDVDRQTQLTCCACALRVNHVALACSGVSIAIRVVLYSQNMHQ